MIEDKKNLIMEVFAWIGFAGYELIYAVLLIALFFITPLYLLVLWYRKLPSVLNDTEVEIKETERKPSTSM